MIGMQELSFEAAAFGPGIFFDAGTMFRAPVRPEYETPDLTRTGVIIWQDDGTFEAVVEVRGQERVVARTRTAGEAQAAIDSVRKREEISS